MNKNILNLILNILSVKKEETMKKSLGTGLMVLFVCLTITALAYGADRLIVQDQNSNTKFVVDQNGMTAIGSPTPVSHLTVVDEATVGTRGAVISQHTNYIDSPLILFRKSRGTNAVPLTVQNGDGNGFFGSQSFDGTAWHYSAGIAFMIDGPVSTGVMPTRIVFRTSSTIDDYMAGRDRLTISANGAVTIGTQTYPGSLNVIGPLYVRGVLKYADYVYSSNYKLESIEEHAKYMWKNKHLQAVSGVTKDENGQEIVEVGAQQRGILEELEKAHIYIEQLNDRIMSLEKKLVALEKDK